MQQVPVTTRKIVMLKVSCIGYAALNVKLMVGVALRLMLKALSRRSEERRMKP
jgi:hypothetical protein